jgi:hypothetical protein
MAGIGDLDFMQRSRRLGVGVVMLVLGGVVGYAWPQHATSKNSESGQILAVGNAIPNEGPWFTFTRATNGSVQRFRLQFATAWKGSPSDSWHYTGLPTCVVPGSTMPQSATLGVVTEGGSKAVPNQKVIIWVECYG